jgi:8-oxo-dGTP pyrophosphatase MutT (NUDIX family)
LSNAQSHLFDEHLISDLAAIIKRGLTEDATLKNIERVYSDLGRIEEIDKLSASIENSCAQPAPEKIEIEIPTDRYAEIHCVAVCISPTGQVLVGRRPSTKRRYPSCLEFGCGQLKLGESFSDCLKRAYKEDFGVDLNLSDPVVPIRTYEIHDAEEHRIIPGIIFFAEVADPESVKSNFSKGKHSEVLWINPAEISNIQQNCVPNFESTVLEAIAAWKMSKAKP